MKKGLAILLAAAVLTGFSACGSSRPAAEEPSTTEAADAAQSSLRYLIINSEPCVVTAADGFDNAGVTGFLCDATATYAFKASSADTKWSVFVLDQEFNDGARYLPQAETPALEGDGTLTIEAGKIIYILCSESAFSADEPSAASLSIDYAE